MSGLQPKCLEKTTAVIARFDDLFTPGGIAFNADNAHLLLHIADSHSDVEPVTTPPAQALKGKPQLRFEGAEHTAIGDNTRLRFVENAEPVIAQNVPLHLPNGLALTYGQVLALGGDFYGIVDRPINEGATPADRLQRFIAAFDTLAALPTSKVEATQILAIMQKEIDAVKQAIKDGKQPHEAYDALGDTLSEEWNRITGGGSFVSALFPLGRYLKLAANNADHFGEWARLAYIAGHTAALQTAAAAHASQDELQLERAYAMNAFADHYLTDLFSSGHLRVPRKAMAAAVTPSDLGSLITRFMHDEDSKFGLKVRNGHGEQWRAFGDKRYFDATDADNRNQVNQAVQDSADEVYAAYSSGTVPTTFNALQRLPDLTFVMNLTNNFSPLFRLQGNKVLRRKDVNNLNDTTTVDDWWGWSTYLLLKDYHPSGNTN
ncbi:MULTISPECIES: phospholipase [Pseudomonas]|uniref:Phospholipase n=1 Tax=Pseudomonas aphyarum TaxID=2942629 RepID=A0ABT5PMG3_9PSED|nr:phospholipase [Pseudomonas aphyarum]MDD0971300.1 phospholipase [Pseudomonas aphyarum]MDD1125003.1 phospholipase [Pseudomonas aphyarum]